MVSVALLPQISSAQVIRGMLIGGVNFTQVDGDEIYGFHRQGVNLGVGAMIPFTRNWSVTLETLFSQKGSYQAPFQYFEQKDTLGNVIAILTGEYDLRMNYVEVPVLIQYTDKDVVSAGVGVSYGRLVGITEKEHGNQVTTTTVSNGPYKTDNWEIIGDIKLPLYKSLRINLRYSYSLAKLRTRDFYNIYGEYIKTRDQFHNLFSIRLIWMFNDKGKSLQEQREER